MPVNFKIGRIKTHL